MKRSILTAVVAVAVCAATLAAQGQPPAPQQGQPAAPAAQPGQPAQPTVQPAQPAGPAAKTPEEAQAVQAMLQSQDADAMIKNADDLLTRFAETQFKEAAYGVKAQAYQMKGEPAKAQAYAEQLLALNPKNLQANLMLGELIPAQTAERALDKEEKLAKAEKHLQAVIDIANSGKPNPQLTDAQWEESKKYIIAQVRNDFGMIAINRKNYDQAIKEFRAAMEADPQQAAYGARLAVALFQGGKHAEALAQADKMLADPQLHPQIKQLVTNVKDAATKASQAK